MVEASLELRKFDLRKALVWLVRPSAKSFRKVLLDFLENDRKEHDNSLWYRSSFSFALFLR